MTAGDVTSGPQPNLRDADVVLRPSPGDGGPTVGFVVERGGVVAGRVQVRRVFDDVGELCWDLAAAHRGLGTGRRAVRLLISYCFNHLAMARVEARVEPDNVAALRLASRAGLRREGLVRGRNVRAGQRRDDVLLARLATDPAPDDPEGFRALLNAALPTKRVIAQGLLRDLAGRVLLCELTYKPDWDLPGGVVELGESPLDAVGREVYEELGVRVAATSLLAVDWLPAWAGWDDACLFVFDLGTVQASLTDSMVLEPREIAAVHWCDPAEVRRRTREPTAARIEHVVSTEGAVGSHFLHGGRLPPSIS